MIKCLIFDLDGVLIDMKNIHFNALNKALPEEFNITYFDHLYKYDGLSTLQKLKCISKEKNLPAELYDDIILKKQKYTSDFILGISEDLVILNTLSFLKEKWFFLLCCSNSTRNTLTSVLEKLWIISLFKNIYSNEDIEKPKPDSMIYTNAIWINWFIPKECLIIEDSPIWLEAAYKSWAHVMRVDNSKDISVKKILKYINKMNFQNISDKKIWVNDKLNVVIPMAWLWTRFANNGYTLPKPFIDVLWRPMIYWVIKNLSLEANFIFIVQKKHVKEYNFRLLLDSIIKKYKIIEIDNVTEWAAMSVLLAEKIINCNSPLLIVNSDQYINWDAFRFYYFMQESKYDWGILTFPSHEEKWSYVKMNNSWFINEVAEKKVISNQATVWIYYWKYWKDFVKYAKIMIWKNFRVNNEFYVCPVYNEAISDWKIIVPFWVEKMWWLWTPEDLNFFLNMQNEMNIID